MVVPIHLVFVVGALIKVAAIEPLAEDKPELHKPYSIFSLVLHHLQQLGLFLQQQICSSLGPLSDPGLLGNQLLLGILGPTTAHMVPLLEHEVSYVGTSTTTDPAYLTVDSTDPVNSLVVMPLAVLPPLNEETPVSDVQIEEVDEAILSEKEETEDGVDSEVEVVKAILCTGMSLERKRTRHP
ncbi:hypothetical protein M9H77_36028 [Catharanthus roseus]|uniref:Uncharacterized protein n=1 Tax=Catharanthus roseus TaxID=4058 RepID=A0ACB9ZRF9_CATRO|nr:hypothetical protein M9H77_36028 [Catharanthus roseus]